MCSSRTTWRSCASSRTPSRSCTRAGSWRAGRSRPSSTTPARPTPAHSSSRFQRVSHERSLRSESSMFRTAPRPRRAPEERSLRSVPVPRSGRGGVMRLGFNTRVSFSDDAGAAQGLADGIELFKTAEALGYQSGWVYQRHFDHYLSSPLPFLAAAGQHTHRITLGTAVLPMRYQDPILLAEAAGVTDLLVGRRLQLAVATGANAAFDAVFGAADTDTRTEAERRQTRFLAAIAGETLHTIDGPGQGAPVGTELKVTPHSPDLRSRVRQGAGSLGSAIRGAELGIGLITGTVLHGLAEGETFGEYQARLVAAYRTTWRVKYDTEPPPVAVAASILPGTTASLRERYAAYDRERRTEGMH